MAEIDIQKKKPSAWLWVIGLIILALLIWLAFNMFGGGRRTSGGGTRPTGIIESPRIELVQLA